MRVCLNALLTVAFLLAASSALAQRTDELVLWNGNTITGEVKSLQQGKLKFKTDHAGTIYIEWEFINALASSSFYDVENQDGVHYYGSLSKAEESGFLMVLGPTGPVVLDMDMVVTIAPIKKTFWNRVDGSLNIGASYTSADSILQYSLEGDATYRQRKHSEKITLSSIQTRIRSLAGSTAADSNRPTRAICKRRPASPSVAIHPSATRNRAPPSSRQRYSADTISSYTTTQKPTS